MFISRDGKESHLESLACFSTLIVFYRFTLPPTLSKNYELFFKFAPRNFLSCTGSQRYIPSGHDGLILLARLATQNIERVILSGWRRALLINPLHPNISMQILLTVLCTYPIVLSREIDLSIRGSFTY